MTGRPAPAQTEFPLESGWSSASDDDGHDVDAIAYEAFQRLLPSSHRSPRLTARKPVVGVFRSHVTIFFGDQTQRTGIDRSSLAPQRRKSDVATVASGQAAIDGIAVAGTIGSSCVGRVLRLLLPACGIAEAIPMDDGHPGSGGIERYCIGQAPCDAGGSDLPMAIS